MKRVRLDSGFYTSGEPSGLIVRVLSSFCLLSSRSGNKIFELYTITL